MFTLHGAQRLGSAAIELGFERSSEHFDIVPAPKWEPESESAPPGRINPLMQIPTRVFSDESAMSKSAAILIQLGLQFPEFFLLQIRCNNRLTRFSEGGSSCNSL